VSIAVLILICVLYHSGTIGGCAFAWTLGLMCVQILGEVVKE